jgi:hypothetical protein
MQITLICTSQTLAATRRDLRQIECLFVSSGSSGNGVVGDLMRTAAGMPESRKPLTGRSRLFRATPRRGPDEQARRSKAKPQTGPAGG